MTFAVLYGHEFDVIWGLATSLIGAVLGVALQAVISHGAPQTVIQQAVVNQTVNVSRTARSSRTRRSSRHRTPVIGDNEQAALALGIAVGLIAVYLRWRHGIAVSLTIAALSIVGLGVGIGLYAALRVGVRRFPLAVVVPALGVAVFAFVDGRALSQPSFSHGRYAVLLRSFDRGGLTNVVDRFHLEGLLFVAYQVIGVLFLIAADLLVTAAVVFAAAQINTGVTVRGSRLWSFINRLSRAHMRRPIALAGTALVFAGISYPLCSGAIYNLFHRIAPAPVTPRPSSAPRRLDDGRTAAILHGLRVPTP